MPLAFHHYFKLDFCGLCPGELRPHCKPFVFLSAPPKWPKGRRIAVSGLIQLHTSLPCNIREIPIDKEPERNDSMS